MNKAEIRAEAYMIATGNVLTEAFTYHDFIVVDTSLYLSEDFENWDHDAINKLIQSLAEDIIRVFGEY